MIAIDAVQNALRSPQPWSALDELVRAELAAGRLTDHIHDELAATLDEVRAAPDHDEDREEPLLDTLDRLNGFCRAEVAYQNPPILPTEDEIAKLPRWARVAFAARCARRVLPLFRSDWDVPADGREAALFELVTELEETVKGAVVTEALRQIKVWIYGDAAPPVAASVGNAAYGAVTTVREPEVAVGYARRTAHSAIDAVEKHSGIDCTADIRHDFDLLARLASAYHWTDDAPVPPEVFGPLWPEGKPAGWPDDPDLPKRTDIALEAVVSERVSETMIEDEIVNLFLAMNRFHIARTGDPLTVEDFHPFLAALVPAGV